MAGEHRKVTIPFESKPAGWCKWCGGKIVHGRVKVRRWHDGREDEPRCLREYSVQTNADTAKAVLLKERGPWCAQCGPPPLGRTQDRVLRVNDGRSYASYFDWPDPYRDLSWEERRSFPLSAWNDPFAEILDLVNPPRYPESYRHPGSPRVFAMQAVVRPLQVDHVVAIIDGGGFGLENLQLLCGPCHRAKTGRENSARAARRREERTAAARAADPQGALL